MEGFGSINKSGLIRCDRKFNIMELRLIPKLCTRIVMCCLPALLFLSSCKENDLERFDPEQVDPRTISAGDMDSTIMKDDENITVKLRVKLSQAAAKAFEVGLSVDNQLLEEAIEQGQLTNTLVLQTGSYQLPNVVQIPFGAKEASFSVPINITALERVYGKNVALGIKLSNPSKGNLTDQEHDITTLLLETDKVLNLEDIHYLSFQKGGELLEIANKQNYTVNSGGISIPVDILLAGKASRAFEVSVVSNADTINKLIANGTLPENTQLLRRQDYSVDSIQRVPANTKQFPLSVGILWEKITDQLDHPLAFALDLRDPSRHVLSPDKATIVLLIYPDRVAEIDITDQGEFSVSRDNGDGPDGREGSKKLIDGNYSSKFLTNWDVNNLLWFQVLYPEPTLAGAYTFTSGDDASERDPKDWNLEASLDGTEWTTLDTRTGESFSERFQTKRYEFSSTIPYRYYRVNVTANHGGGAFQMIEWRLIRTP